MSSRNTRHSDRDPSLLSPSQYDDDASSLSDRSDRSDQDTDSEDDEVLMAARTSSDIREHDRSVLEEEEERDREIEAARSKQGRRESPVGLPRPLRNLFARASTADLSRQMDTVDGDRKERRRMRRLMKKEKLIDGAEHGEDGALMYEMEEGGMKEGSATGSSSDSEDNDRQGLLGMQEERARQWRWKQWIFIYALIGVGFSILVLLAWKLSLGHKKQMQKLSSNGTALFAPTTILISLDGFRADFLRRGITPRMNSFITEGVSPQYMNPTFPSVTFPNHYTMVTGLYPESHGIVSNTFWDPALKAQFHNTDPTKSLQTHWWGGQPLWVTAEKAGIRTGVHMWPGSEASIGGSIKPAFVDKYNGSETLSRKVDRILGFLDMPGQESQTAALNDMRPQLIAAYVPDVDADGHLFGPNSTEIRTTISEVDNMLDNLFHGLEARNLTDIVNVVIVSDHGMATTSVDRMIQLDDIIDIDMIEHIDGWPLFGLRPKDPADLEGLYNKLFSEAAANPNFDVYLRDVNMPERYHFSKNDRIAPLWVIPKTSWAIATKQEFDIKDSISKGIAYHPRGLHGYDNEDPLMRAIFIARGPAFPHAPNSRVENFQNTNVYNIICDSLNLEPHPNNGTLRLPLKTIGTHTSDISVPEPEDPVDSSGLNGTITIDPIEASSAADESLKPPHMVGVNPPDSPDELGVIDEEDGKGGLDTSVDRPVVEDENQMTDEEKGEAELHNFWDYFLGKVDGWKAWVGGLVGIGGGEVEEVESTEGEKQQDGSGN